MKNLAFSRLRQVLLLAFLAAWLSPAEAQAPGEMTTYLPPAALSAPADGLGAPIIGPGVVPVIDAANLAQSILDHLKRLFEILQRATQIVQGIKNLENWLLALSDLEEIPYRGSIIPFLQGLGELLTEFERVRGQYQALSYALVRARDEFDLTFPGAQSLTRLGDGRSYRIQTEAGVYTFLTPIEYHRYQDGRTLQLMRQALKATSRHRTDLAQAESHLTDKLDGLTRLAHDTVGTQQILEMSTAFTALNAQQLIALRNQILILTNIELATASRELNRQMEGIATVEDLQDALSKELRQTYGALLPQPTAGPLASPFPFWVEGQ